MLLKKMGVLFASFMMSFALIGCSSDSSDSSGSSDGTVYKIVTDSSYAPFEFEESDGTYVGIDIEIFQEIAEVQGIEYTMEHPGFDAAIQAVAAGQADGVIAGMSIKEERKETYDFSDPYYTAGITYAVKAGNTAITSTADFAGKAVGGKLGTTSADWCEANKEALAIAECVTYEDGPPMYDALSSGAIDVLFDDAPIIGYAIAQGQELEMPQPGDIYDSMGLGFAVKKGENAELLEKFNAGLRQIIDDGTYAEILAKYGATSGAVA